MSKLKLDHLEMETGMGSPTRVKLVTDSAFVTLAQMETQLTTALAWVKSQRKERKR